MTLNFCLNCPNQISSLESFEEQLAHMKDCITHSLFIKRCPFVSCRKTLSEFTNPLDHFETCARRWQREGGEFLLPRDNSNDDSSSSSQGPVTRSQAKKTASKETASQQISPEMSSFFGQPLFLLEISEEIRSAFLSSDLEKTIVENLSEASYVISGYSSSSSSSSSSSAPVLFEQAKELNIPIFTLQDIIKSITRPKRPSETRLQDLDPGFAKRGPGTGRVAARFSSVEPAISSDPTAGIARPAHLVDDMFRWLLATSTELPQVGSFVSVPVLPNLLPNGLQESLQRTAGRPDSLLIFITEQRRRLLNDLRKKTEKDPSTWNLQPIGPQGVGKSIFCYLIAVYAAVNCFPLIYMPELTTWTSAYSVGAKAHVFIRGFYRLNSHWFPQSANPLFGRLQAASSQPLTEELESECQRLQQDLLDAFSVGFPDRPKMPSFTIIDEHNLLFDTSAAQPSQFDQFRVYYRHFTDWSLKGIVVLCGSSHSKFIRKRDVKNVVVLVSLVPFTTDETIAYLTSRFSPCYIRFLTTKTAENIEARFGGMPRILSEVRQRLQESAAESEGEITRRANGLRLESLQVHQIMGIRFRRFCSEELHGETTQQFISAVEMLFEKRATSLFNFGQALFDPGMFYLSKTTGQDPMIKTVNSYAWSLVVQKYAELRNKRTESSFRSDPTGWGIELEKQVEAGLILGGKLVFKPIQSMNKPKVPFLQL